MAGTWQTPADRSRLRHAAVPGSWWHRHWANPSFSGSLIGVTLVLVVMAVGIWIGENTLHLSWSDLDLARYFRN